MEAYFQYLERSGAKGSAQDRYRSDAWIIPAFGQVQVSKLTRARIEKWLHEMADSPRKSRTGIGRKPKAADAPQTDDQRRARRESANRVLAILKAALTQCIERNIADSPDRPWQLVRRFRGTSKARMRFLTVEEQVRLVGACPDYFARLVSGALLTGCRYGEMTRLRCKDYDPNNGSIFVEESKSGKPRHVFLTEEGRELFDGLTRGSGPEDFIFTNSAEGRRKYGPGPSQWRGNEQHPLMQAACREAGIEPVTFHELRHTYASMLVNRGCVLSVVAKLLGHTSTKMVERHYGHLAPGTVRAELLRAMPWLGIVKRAE
jgi:integrase